RAGGAAAGRTRAVRLHPVAEGGGAAPGRRCPAAEGGGPCGLRIRLRGRAGGADRDRLQLPDAAGGVDLRRLQRGAEEHPRERRAGLLTPWTSTTRKIRYCCRTR